VSFTHDRDDRAGDPGPDLALNGDREESRV
jgi:hypothetical protein